MWISLLWMWLLCGAPGRGGSDRVCPRKEPPPGVVVVAPGRELVLTCGGLVAVDGVQVNLTRKNPDATKKRSSAKVNTTQSANQEAPGSAVVNATQSANQEAPGSAVVNTTQSANQEAPGSAVVNTTQSANQEAPGSAVVSNQSGGNSHTHPHVDPAFTASPDPLRTTGTDGESDWGGGGTAAGGEGGYGEEGGGRVTRGLRSRPQWSWNKTSVGRRDAHWGEESLGRTGASLSLSPLRLSDSGKYSCFHRGRERFSVKVIVEDPPENPSLFCYKKSPSSKIRCEWTPRKPVVKNPHCYLLLTKIATIRPSFSYFPCSYSSQRSVCWCSLDYDDDDQRTLHMAYLCVSSMAGSAASDLLHFTPLDILKPDPPSNVSVRQEEGHRSTIKVSWNLPSSWKQQDSHYALIYELRYRPVQSSLEFTQTRTIEGWRSYTITDAIPGVEYVIELRAKDEYDGQWSEWSTPLYERSWTVAVTVMDDSSSPAFDFIDPVEESGSGSDGEHGAVAPGVSAGGHWALWAVGPLAVFSVVLSVFVFRHKDRFLSKLQNLSVVTQFVEAPPAPPPAVTAAPEGQALVTFDPPVYKEDEEEDGETVQRKEGLHFNNSSYFFLQTE